MKILAQDVKIGDFIASDYGLCVGFFDYDGNEEADTEFSVQTIEEYIGDSATPIYFGQKYDSKLRPSLSLVKNPCVSPDPYLSEFELRGILRAVWGIRGYVWMNLLDDNPGEDIAYKIRVINVKYQLVTGRVAAIILEMEADSQFGYSREQSISQYVSANTAYNIYTPMNDDIHNYLLPVVKFTASSSGQWTLTNQTDNSWQSIMKNVGSGETITIDSQREIITTSSSSHRSTILADFNLRFPRMISPKSVYTSSLSGTLEFIFRSKIRVGFVTK